MSAAAGAIETEVRRIDLAQGADLEREIRDLCTTVGGAGYRLASSFVYRTQLVLIFQREGAVLQGARQG